MKPPRITGMDLVIAAFLPLVIYYGIYLDLGQNREEFPRQQLHLFLDGAVGALLFSTAVSTGMSITTGNGLRALQKYLMKRGSFFLILGLVLSFIWPTNLFMLLGGCSLLSALIIPLNSTFLFFVGAIVSLGAIVMSQFGNLMIVINPWDGKLPFSLIKHFLISGPYAMMPWFFFWILGLIYSRGDFFSKRGRDLRSFMGVVLVILGILLEFYFQNILLDGFTASSHPFNRSTIFDLHLPPFLILTTGVIIILFNFIMKWNERLSAGTLVTAIRYFGKMKYSVLLAQGIVGGILGFKLTGLETYGLGSVILMGVLGSVLSIIVSYFWTKRFGLGPVEKVLKMFI